MTGQMSRLVLLAEAPPHLDSEQTQAWLLRELAALVGRPGVDRVSLSRLESVSAHFARGFSWLIEVECAGPREAETATSKGAFRDLVGDLRLVGMHPSVALANHPIELTDRSPG
jgi:hypothetical protein